MFGEQAVDRLNHDSWVISRKDQYAACVYTRSGQPDTYRFHHVTCRIGIADNPRTVFPAERGKYIIQGPCNNNDLVNPAGGKCTERVLYERTAVKRKQLLWSAHPLRATCRRHDGRYCEHHASS